MLAYILAVAVALGSFALFMAAFFFPEVHRRGDLVWSGVGLLYALVLWVCAGQIRGGLLLGQTASVALLGWFVWQNLTLRRSLAPREQRTEVPGQGGARGMLSQLPFLGNRRQRSQSAPASASGAVPASGPAPVTESQPEVAAAEAKSGTGEGDPETAMETPEDQPTDIAAGEPQTAQSSGQNSNPFARIKDWMQLAPGRTTPQPKREEPSSSESEETLAAETAATDPSNEGAAAPVEESDQAEASLESPPESTTAATDKTETSQPPLPEDNSSIEQADPSEAASLTQDTDKDNNQ